MSYIHQALKKAQTERDDRHGKYTRLLRPPGAPRGTGKRWALIAVAALAILSLGAVVHIWLGSRVRDVRSEIQTQPIKDPSRSRQEWRLDVTAWLQQGRLQHQAGRTDEARRSYEKALRSDPGCTVALNNLGVLLMQGRDYGAARSHFEKAIRLKPDYADPYYNLACLFSLTNRPEEGLRYLSRAVEIRPQARSWALKDADLERLRSQPGFEHAVK